MQLKETGDSSPGTAKVIFRQETIYDKLLQMLGEGAARVVLSSSCVLWFDTLVMLLQVGAEGCRCNDGHQGGGKF